MHQPQLNTINTNQQRNSLSNNLRAHQTVTLIGRKIANNDVNFFRKFTDIRPKLEAVLIENKDLIATILQKHLSPKRVNAYCDLLDGILEQLHMGVKIDEEFLIQHSGLQGKLVVGSPEYSHKSFSDDSKSKAFINVALSSALKCAICQGYLDPEKSVSYDHIVRARENGVGTSENCSLTHPYCNQSIKQ